jgi:hypothetical protein
MITAASAVPRVPDNTEEFSSYMNPTSRPNPNNDRIALESCSPGSRALQGRNSKKRGIRAKSASTPRIFPHVPARRDPAQLPPAR